MVKFSLAVLLVVAATQQTVARIHLHESKISNGHIAIPHSIPYQVAISLKDYYDEGKYDEALVCGGSIITEKHILTAGYCCEKYSEKKLVVVAGEHKFYEQEGTEQVVEVRKFYLHPDYSMTGNAADVSATSHDICVAELERPLVFDKYVSAVKLPEKGQEFSGIARVSGWGNIYPEGTESTWEGLIYADIPIISDERCMEIYEYLKESTICAGGEDGKDACIQDVGGPMVCQGDVQCGITAYGIGCGSNPMPRFYTKISDYLPFISTIINPQ